MGREPTYKELFDRTHKRSGGDGNYVDNKSKSISVRNNISLLSYMILNIYIVVFDLISFFVALL